MTEFLGDLGLSIIVSTPIALADLSGSNLISNSGFETLDGGNPIFDSWIDDDDSAKCTITQDATDYHGGSYSCKITTSDPEGVGHVYQDFAVVPNAVYEFSLWSLVTESSHVTQGRFAIYDVSNSEWIATMRGTGAFSAVEWLKITDIFRTPDGCTTVRLYLYQNIFTSKAVYYDDINIQKRETLAPVPIPQWSGAGGVSSYMHTLSALMGFDTMTMNTAGDLATVGNWLEEGLGNHIIVNDMVGTTIWEGFVNQISARIGGLTVTIGPFTDIVNRGRIVYATMDWDVIPPVSGVTVRGEWQDNIESQGRYGILGGVITGGQGNASEMTQLLTAIVEHTAWPETTQNFSLMAGTDMQLTISCLGYAHLLNKVYYYEISTAGEENVSDKLGKVLNADPNNMFSDINAEIETNTTQVHVYEGDDKTALAIIKELLAMGDSNFNRYTFGVYEKQIVRYKKVVNEPTYYQNLETNMTYNRSSVRVHPWEIRPGVWMFMTDFMPGRQLTVQDQYADAEPTSADYGENFRKDPRYIFIETVTYNAPYAFTVSGGRVSKFKQRIEKLGLGGI